MLIFNSYDVYNFVCSYNRFYIGKTNKSFKIHYTQHGSVIKCKKHILINTSNIYFDVELDLNEIKSI